MRTMTAGRSRPLLALAGCLLGAVVLLAAGAARAAESAAEKEVRQRREALLKATNAHDVKTIRTFMDPTYTAKTKDGKSMGFQETIDTLTQLFRQAPDLKETLKIEKVAVNGETAEVTNASTIALTDPEGKAQTIEQRYLQTWKKIRGKWLLVAEQEL